MILLEFYFDKQHLRADEPPIQNAATKEQLSIRNAIFKKPGNEGEIQYVEIVRHPAGADVNMREWIKKRAYFVKKYKNHPTDGDEDQVIWIFFPTIG